MGFLGSFAPKTFAKNVLDVSRITEEDLEEIKNMSDSELIAGYIRENEIALRMGGLDVTDAEEIMGFINSNPLLKNRVTNPEDFIDEGDVIENPDSPHNPITDGEETAGDKFRDVIDDTRQRFRDERSGSFIPDIPDDRNLSDAVIDRHPFFEKDDDEGVGVTGPGILPGLPEMPGLEVPENMDLNPFSGLTDFIKNLIYGILILIGLKVVLSD